MQQESRVAFGSSIATLLNISIISVFKNIANLRESHCGISKDITAIYQSGKTTLLHKKVLQNLVFFLIFIFVTQLCHITAELNMQDSNERFWI